MKLNETKPYYESSGDLEEHFFSIKDQGMIFDILRSKMYSNPILAICREITSNARDAHREIGKPELPVHIHLPVGLEPHYAVKDFGPGISPDRMVNIFIQYTASTKRDDNTQTGGFGLGAKTPFAYSDTFTVVTIHEGIKYSYACSIDDTKVGKLIQLDKVATDEPNSTEIKLKVNPQDFNFFRQWTEQACRHWTTLPIISGGRIDWSPLNKVIAGPNWAVVNADNNNSSYNYNYNNYNRTAKLVIDGIEYPLELDTLRKYADTKLIDSCRGTFVMYFGVGELTLAANREQVFWDKRTQDVIKGRLEAITKEIKKLVEDKIAAFPNLWEANVYYRKELTSAFSNLNFLGRLSWNNHILNNGHIDLKCGIYTFSRGTYSRKTGTTDPSKLKRSFRTGLDFVEGTELWLNDLPIKDPTPRHVKKAFEDDPKLQNIQVVCPNDKCTEKDLNAEIFLDQMQPKRLSSITKASARAYTPAASRLLVFKFDIVASAFRQVSYDAMEEDTNGKVICSLTRETNYSTVTRSATLANGTHMPTTALRSLLDRNPKFSIYGLDKDTDPVRVKEEFSDFKPLDEFIDEKVLNNTTINYVEIKYAQGHTYHVDERMLKHLPELGKLVNDQTSAFMTKLNLHDKIKRLNGDDKSLLEIYESAKGKITDVILKDFLQKNPEWDIEKTNKAYEKKYPLLGAINTYNIGHVVEHIAAYVNMVDKI